jgi:membrane protease YdiL (CAAX protease family)
VLLNLGLRFWLVRTKKQAIHALTATFWSGVFNALYFIVVSVLLHVWKLAPDKHPEYSFGLLALIGIPAGVLLWYLSTLARKAGLELFGRGDIVAAEDAILRVPPDMRYLTWGVLNLALIQPLGRELFMRGVFLPVLLSQYGLWPALGITLVVEFFLRMNIVWLFQTALYSLAMGLMYYYSGSALSGLVAACIAGLLHGSALAYMGMRDLRPAPPDAASFRKADGGGGQKSG